VSAVLLVQDLERLGVRIRADHDQLVIDAPRGVLTDDVKAKLAACKPELLQLVRERPLAEVAANLAPLVRFTIRETGNTKRDFDLLGRVRKVIQEFQPGGNHVYLKIVTTDGRRVVVEWRAVAARDLRMAIAQVLARAALQDKADIHAR
jgi:hypothetical protein